MKINSTTIEDMVLETVDELSGFEETDIEIINPKVAMSRVMFVTRDCDGMVKGFVREPHTQSLLDKGPYYVNINGAVFSAQGSITEDACLINILGCLEQQAKLEAESKQEIDVNYEMILLKAALNNNDDEEDPIELGEMTLEQMGKVFDVVKRVYEDTEHLPILVVTSEGIGQINLLNERCIVTFGVFEE